ncbi:MAG: M20/M25/M40 family metallo-hydrolase, partial [Draconibacterium sp.]|nr:M20/M25/M40 family metallo-hydrolase [Draconibacterium sp.]
MYSKIIITFFVFVFISLSSIAQDKVTKKIIELGTTDNRSMEHLDILSNRFGGRLVGSDAYENAANWAVWQFKEWGMDAYLDEVGEVPVGFNRGPWFGKMLGETGMNLHFATPSYTSGTKGVQRGHVLLEPRTKAEFERMKGQLKGAWVLIGGENTGWPIDWSEKADADRDSIKKVNAEIEIKNNEIRRENWYARGTDKPQKELLPLNNEPALFYKEMKEAGILGIIQSAKTPIRVLYDRKNLEKITWDNLPSVPDIKLDEHQYKIIKQMAEERRYFQLEFDIRNHFKMGPVKYHNVVGVIPGIEHPDELVILGGHLDAFDVATGGVDCGSGVTPHMEAARLIMEAGGKPKRTIMVILFAAEEFGLFGSKHWVKENEDKWDKIANMFHRDGGPTVPMGINVTEAMYDDFEKICKPLNDINPDFPFTLGKRKPTRKPKV